MSRTSIDMLEHAEYLEFVVLGNPTEDDWVSVMHRIVESISMTGKTRILVDATGVEQTSDSMVRYRMGVRTGETFGIRARLAALRPEWDEDNFWETVATNRGAIAKSGDDRVELIEWLLSDN